MNVKDGNPYRARDPRSGLVVEIDPQPEAGMIRFRYNTGDEGKVNADAFRGWSLTAICMSLLNSWPDRFPYSASKSLLMQ